MNQVIPILLGGCVAVPFAISVTATGIVRAWARRHGFVDRPGGHKGHAAPIALGGGVAITAAILLPLLGTLVAVHLGRTMLPEEVLGYTFSIGGHTARISDLLGGVALKMPAAMAIVGGAIVMHILGLIDDVRPLGPAIKMVVMTIVALSLTAGFGIRSLDLLGTVPATILTTFWIVLITNAFNFMDNMDGLSAGVAGITAAFFAASALVAGQVFVPALGLILVGAVLGFLVYNFSPASIFMGDSGSLVIGYLMAVLTVVTNYYNPEQQRMPFGVLAPLVVLAVPLYDVTSVVLVRLREGVSPFRGDRRHFSHRLVRRGLQTRSAVLTIYLATAATGCSSLLLPLVSWPFAVLIVAQCFCVVLIVAILESTGGAGRAANS